MKNKKNSKKIALIIFVKLLRFSYIFFKIFPTQKKITFISRQSNKPSLDQILLRDEIKKTLYNYKVVIMCKKIEPGFIKKFMYAINILFQMYHISTSKFVILDSYCVAISVLNHKKNLKVIQLWHALGLMKKAGYSIINQFEGRLPATAQILKMHNNYDYIFMSSDNLREAFKQVFKCEDKQLKTFPLPRVDMLRNKNYIEETKNKIISKYPQLKTKLTILYVPTFRKNETLHEKKIYELIREIDYKKYNLIIKLHPVSKLNIISDNIIFDKDFTSTEMLAVSDYIITDYSTIIYEAAILKKPMYFYTFDKEIYKYQRNFFIDYEKEIPGLLSDNPYKIVEAIDSNYYDMNKIDTILNKYVDLSSKTCTKDIVEFLIQIIQ